MYSKSVALRLYCWAILLSLSSASWATDELFKAAQSYESGGISATSVAVADVNGDGKPDLLVANQCGADPNCTGIGSVGVLLGNGDGSFQAALSYESGGHEPMSVAVGDVNGDGKLDLLVTNSCKTEGNCDIGIASVLLGNGDGSFQTAQNYESGGQNATSIAVGDVNGDGKPDLLVTNYCVSFVSCSSGAVGVLLGNGDGTFQTAHSYGSGGADTWSLAVRDVNGDAKPDLLVANVQGVAVLLGNGDGTFQSARTYSSGGSDARSVAIGDVNRDGRLDLLVANECNGGGLCDHGIVGVLLGNGDGSFQTATTYNSSGLWPFSITVGDVNSDGKLDVLVINECLSYDICDTGLVGVLLGEDDGTFQTAQQYKSGGRNPISMAVADVNGDGKLDALVANRIGGVGVLLNNSGSHSATVTTLVSSQNPSPAGQPVTFTATVTSENGGVVTGTVTFKYGGGRTMAQVTLADGQAAYTLLPKNNGVHWITATYSGDTQNAGSTSPTLTQYVKTLPVKTVLHISASPSPSLVGQPVTFTAKVTSIFGKIPDGELVTFYDGTTTLGSVTLVGGAASYTTSSLAAGKHFIKATFAGDPTFKTSSRHLWQVVNTAGSK